MGLLYYLSRPFRLITATRTLHVGLNRARSLAPFCPRVRSLEDRTVPAADAFADAIVLSGSFAVDTGSNVGATAEADEPVHADGDTVTNSVWWSWTATADGPVEVNTFGSTFDTVLAVYTGSTVQSLELIAANDDAGSMQSSVSFDAVAGTTYSIAVDGFGDATGDILLHLGTTPANDNFANAAALSEGTTTGDNLAATEEGGEPNGAGASAPINSVWWTWTATTDGPVEVNTFGSDFDTLLAVYTGSSVDSLTLTAANDDAGDGLQSEVLFDAVAGTTYAIAVDGSTNVTGRIVLNLSTTPTASNTAPLIAAQSFAVVENSFGGTVVGTVAASDPDAGQSLSYTITAGNESGAFSINHATGEIQVLESTSLDYETNPAFVLTVQVTDNGSPPLMTSASVTVNLTDVNEAPSVSAAGPFTVNEGSAEGTVVGTVVASDPDAGQSLSYAIVSGNDAGSFAIDSNTGEITVANAATLNHTTTPTAALTVRITDNGSPALSSDAVVNIAIDDVNEAPAIADQSFGLPENSAGGTVVGTVAASDPDVGQVLNYAITDGNTSGAFAIDNATGEITVANAAALDFETTPTFTLTLTVTDNGSPPLSSTATVTINLSNVNEAPVLDNTGNMSLTAITQGNVNNPGTRISTLLASAGGVRVTDPDALAVQGIAVVAADTSHGSWQFSTNDGSTWSALDSVSVTSARLLAADALIRFQPASDYSGTLAQAITFRAWDQTSGTNGGLGNTALNGGSTAFSIANETASLTVNAATSTPQQQIALIISQVQSLIQSGDLSPSEGTSMISHLMNASRKFCEGNITAAKAQLRAFINDVQGAVIDGSLTQEQGDPLIAAANALL